MCALCTPPPETSRPVRGGYCFTNTAPLTPGNLQGHANWQDYLDTMVCGEPTNRPRMVDVPIEIPLPEAERGGSIYETQTILENPMFADAA